jgi:hypothetical protein
LAAKFRDIADAPRDGTLIEVRHGPDQIAVLARWAGQTQAWIADADPVRRTLHRVSVWRPAPEGPGAKKAAEMVRAVIAAPAASVPKSLPAIVHAKRPKPRR